MKQHLLTYLSVANTSIVIGMSLTHLYMIIVDFTLRVSLLCTAVLRSFLCVMVEADASDMGLEEVLTSVKKAPKSSRKRQNSQSIGSGGRRGSRVNESQRDDEFDMLHTNWFDDKMNGDDDMRHAADKKPEKPKSRKKSDSKAEKAAGKTSRRSRSESENMMQLEFALDEMRDIRPNGGVASTSEQASDGKRRRSSYIQAAWNQDLFANRSDFRLDPMLSPGSELGARFEPEQGIGMVDAQMTGVTDKQVGDAEKTGRTRCRRRTDAAKPSPELADKRELPSTANMTLDANSTDVTANLPNHKVFFSVDCLI